MGLDGTLQTVPSELFVIVDDIDHSPVEAGRLFSTETVPIWINWAVIGPLCRAHSGSGCGRQLVRLPQVPANADFAAPHPLLFQTKSN